MQKKAKLSDFVVAIGTIIFGIIIYILTLDLPTAKLGLGADGFPRVISFGFMVVGCAYLAITLKNGVEFTKISIPVKAYLPTIATVVLALLYVFLLSTVGFLLLTPICMFLVMLCFGYRNYVKGIILSVVFSTITYWLFVKVFLIFLPQGILYF